MVKYFSSGVEENAWLCPDSNPHYHIFNILPNSSRQVQRWVSECNLLLFKVRPSTHDLIKNSLEVLGHKVQ